MSILLVFSDNLVLPIFSKINSMLRLSCCFVFQVNFIVFYPYNIIRWNVFKWVFTKVKPKKFVTSFWNLNARKPHPANSNRICIIKLLTFKNFSYKVRASSFTFIPIVLIRLTGFFENTRLQVVESSAVSYLIFHFVFP